MRKLVLRAAPLALVCLSGLYAQTGQGVVTGDVSDPSGGSVPSAAITLRNQDTGIEQKEVTNRQGEYRFALVPPGMYSITVSSTGFAEKTVKDVKVDPSQTVPVNVVMSLSGSRAVIEVTADTALVQTDSADLAETINTRTVQQTALLTRNVYDLAFLAPSATQGMNMNVSAGGARESGTAYLLNGADNNDNFSEGNPNITPPLESVGEISILTNNFSAQYGRAAGAVISASQKTGTNSFHGVAYEFNRNRDYNANDFFSNRDGADRPAYNRNQFGGEIDGPVIRNRTFFSFAYDQIEAHTANTIYNQVQVPTSSELAAIKAGAGPVAQQILSYYNVQTSDVPCVGEAAAAIGHIGCLNIVDPVQAPVHNYFGRVDTSFGQKNRLAASVNFNWASSVDQYAGAYSPTTSTPIPYTDLEHYWNIALDDTHVFSPSIVNEATVAHNRHYSNAFEGKNGVFSEPSILIDGESYAGTGFDIGPNSEYDISAFTQDRWQVQDNLSWTRGRHSFKFGGGYQYGIVYRNWDLGGNGYYEFANTLGETAAEANANGDATINGGSISNIQDYTTTNFQHDYPYFQETSIDPSTGAAANAYRHYVTKDANVFVNDDWKLTRRLTLNLGLRWERYGAPTEVNGLLAGATDLHGYDPASVSAALSAPVSRLWNTNNRDFGPRVGFAWDIFGNGRTSIRGGYGIFYDRIFDNVWSNAAWNPPFYALADFDASAGNTIYYSAPTSLGGTYVPNTLPGVLGPVSTRLMDVALKDSSVQSFYFGVERQFGQNYLLRVNYQGSLGRHLPVLEYLNRYDGMDYNATLAAEPRPNPLYTSMNYRANRISSDYNSLQTEFQKRFSAGLQFQFSYTWSKLIDEGSDLFTGETLQGAYSQPYYYPSNNALQLERGPGAFDHTHNFKVNLIYEIPFLKSEQGFAGHVFGGWQLSAFYQGYSGHPIEIYNSRHRYAGNGLDPNGFDENIGGDYNLDGVYTDRPDYVGSSVGSAYSNNSPADGIFKDNNPIGCGYAGATTSATGSHSTAACNSANGVVTPSTLFVNPSGYGPHFGELGRNVFRGPWYNDLDAALMKNVRFTEQVGLQLRFEALNAANHPNFDGIVSDVNSGQFGKAQILVGTRGATTSGASSISRVLQLGARLSF